MTLTFEPLYGLLARITPDGEDFLALADLVEEELKFRAVQINYEDGNASLFHKSFLLTMDALKPLEAAIKESPCEYFVLGVDCLPNWYGYCASSQPNQQLEAFEETKDTPEAIAYYEAMSAAAAKRVASPITAEDQLRAAYYDRGAYLDE